MVLHQRSITKLSVIKVTENEALHTHSLKYHLATVNFCGLLRSSSSPSNAFLHKRTFCFSLNRPTFNRRSPVYNIKPGHGFESTVVVNKVAAAPTAWLYRTHLVLPRFLWRKSWRNHDFMFLSSNPIRINQLTSGKAFQRDILAMK